MGLLLFSEEHVHLPGIEDHQEDRVLLEMLHGTGRANGKCDSQDTEEAK